MRRGGATLGGDAAGIAVMMGPRGRREPRGAPQPPCTALGAGYASLTPRSTPAAWNVASSSERSVAMFRRTRDIPTSPPSMPMVCPAPRAPWSPRGRCSSG